MEVLWGTTCTGSCTAMLALTTGSAPPNVTYLTCSRAKLSSHSTFDTILPWCTVGLDVGGRRG